MRVSRRVAAVAIVGVVACAGCTVQTDKAGGDADAVTLTFANPYSHFTYVPQVEAFVSAVADASRGALVLDVENEWGGFAPGFEKATIQDVAVGKVDLAWVGTRAFDLVGEKSLQALTAPFLVDSAELQQAILTSDLPRSMMASIDVDGVAPLAILAGGLRRPFAVDAPLTNLSAFSGSTFQSFESDLNATSTRALGASPVHDVPGGLDSGLADASIQGFEKQFSTVLINGTTEAAPYAAANVVLWPETIVLVANAERLSRLSDRQRGWLDAAATSTSLDSVDNLPDDQEQVALFCASGGRVGTATDAELDELHDAVEPIYEQLRRDSETAGFLQEIATLKAATAKVALEVPAGCLGSAPTDLPAPDSPTTQTAAIEGVYRWELTAEDAAAAGRPDDSRYPWPWITTMTLSDGKWSHSVRDPKQDAEYGGGSYSVDGDLLTLTWDQGYSMHFTFEQLADGSLRLTPTPSTIAEDAFAMTTHDWVRID